MRTFDREWPREKPAIVIPGPLRRIGKLGMIVGMIGVFEFLCWESLAYWWVPYQRSRWPMLSVDAEDYVVGMVLAHTAILFVVGLVMLVILPLAKWIKNG